MSEGLKRNELGEPEDIREARVRKQEMGLQSLSRR